MSLTIHYFEGTALWDKLNTIDEKFNNYSIQCHMDQANQSRFKQSGIKKSMKLDERNGTKYVQFSRPFASATGDEYGKPKVLDSKGVVVEGKNIAQGAKIVCKVISYDTRVGKGSRLEAVMNVEDKWYEPPTVDKSDDVAPF